MIESLKRDLDKTSIRYLEIRIEYYKQSKEGADLKDVGSRRTLAHNALISCFNSFLRNLEDKPSDMLEAARKGRVAIGVWGLNRAVELLRGLAT